MATPLVVVFGVLGLVAVGAAARWAHGALRRRRARRARLVAAAGDAQRALLVHATLEERARIARELHDVVAHHISMIAVQSEAARLLVPDLAPDGQRRLVEIGDTARTALIEMRRLLGVLRNGGEGRGDAVRGAADGTLWADKAVEAGEGVRADRATREVGVVGLAGTPSAARIAGSAGSNGDRGGGDTGPPSRRPQPTLQQLAELVDEARSRTGTTLRFIVRGPVAPVDPGVELTAYRIVQEALTNARRHAPGAAIDVELHYRPDALGVRVRDSGLGTAADGGGDGAIVVGHGLAGMRERTAMLGGRITVGPLAEGGFAVAAVLPREPAP